jgi:lipopolysaccharide/colanic/teichoic acid biosynthesis glycosyltransferase
MVAQNPTSTGCERLKQETFAESPDALTLTELPAWKRVLDIAVIVLASPVWIPLMLIIAAGITLVSRGPVIFRQERVGYKGRLFLCLKFRSMRCNADVRVHKDHLKQLMKSGVPMVKLDRADDPRLIPWGDILRASGLDELPQIFNVLKGDMSLVGPRPCTAYEYAEYLPWQKERFEVLPGLTGLWQVTGKNKTTFAEMVRLDIEYRRKLSPGRDLGILLKTFGVLLQQVGDSCGRRFEKARSLLSLSKTEQENG